MEENEGSSGGSQKENENEPVAVSDSMFLAAVAVWETTEKK